MSKQPLRVTESGEIRWADGTKLTGTGSFDPGKNPATHGHGDFLASPPELEIVVPAMPGVPVPKILTSAIDRARAEGESRGLKLREIDLMTVSIFNDVVTPEGTTVLLYEYIASFSDAKNGKAS